MTQLESKHVALLSHYVFCIYYSDEQPKTSIDEISLLWLFRGC